MSKISKPNSRRGEKTSSGLPKIELAKRGPFVAGLRELREERLTKREAALVKGMLARRDHPREIAALFKINVKTVLDVGEGRRFEEVEPARPGELPQPGLYLLPTEVERIFQKIEKAYETLAEAELALLQIWTRNCD